MNPTKDNRFKIYSFLAILEIIFLNPISIAAGIVALVHAANFNASYKSERWNDFKMQKKHAGIALLVGLTGVILQIGIIICLHLSAQLDRMNKASEVYYRFVLEGNEINLPMRVKELESAGLYFTEDVSGYQLNPGESEMIGCVTDSYRDQNYDLAYATVINPTNELISLNDGIVVGINIHKIPKMEGLKISFPEINLMEGVNFNTSEWQLLRLYGKPDDMSGDDTSNYTQYVWHQEGYDENYYNLILINYMNGQMMEVTIQHNPIKSKKEESDVVEGLAEVERPDDKYELGKEKEDNLETVQNPLLITPKSTNSIEFAIESEDIFCIYDGDNYGYIKMDNQEITGYIYEMAYPFSEGLACVRLEGKYGYIDDKGETILPFIYDDAAPFSEGLAYYVKDGEYGFIKKDGTVAFQFECDSVSSFKDGLAYYSLGGKYGYIDCNGQIAIEAIYDDADYFKDGLARITLDGYVGMINQYGEEVIPIAYDEIFRGEEYLIASTGDKKEYYSFEGNAVLAGEESIDDVHYDDVRAIPDSDLYIAKKDELYGVIDAQGNNVVPFSYDGMNIAGDVKEVLLRVCKDNKYGCLEIKTFTEMIPLEYDYMGLFTDGLAAVSKDGRYGIVKENGEMYVPVDYAYAYILDDGFFYLKKGEITELYNKNGELIFSDNILFISFYGDFFKIEKNDELQIIDKSGNMILSADYWYDMERIYGSYKNSVLKRGVDEQEQLLILDRNMDVDLSEILLKNSITPRIELYWNLTHGKPEVSVANQEGGTTEVKLFDTWDDWSYIKTFRLYDINDSGMPILYTYEKPCIMPGFPMSDSAFWDIRNNQVVEILSGYECGGSMRGDYVCLWRDNETGEVLIGTWGAIGGFGGFANYSYIYKYQDDNVECIADFNCVSQDIRNYDEDELNQKAELFYTEEGIPCTKENIFENEYLDAYYFNDELVTVEEYTHESARFTELHIP